MKFKQHFNKTNSFRTHTIQQICLSLADWRFSCAARLSNAKVCGGKLHFPVSNSPVVASKRLSNLKWRGIRYSPRKCRSYINKWLLPQPAPYISRARPGERSILDKVNLYKLAREFNKQVKRRKPTKQLLRSGVVGDFAER